MNITERFNGKKILIWGKGREGMSTMRFLKDYCSPASIDMIEGSEEDICKVKDGYDLVFKSPGIAVKVQDPKYISQTRLFMEYYGKQTVGITGTKGKSTTSSLLYHVLKDCRRGGNTLLVGNIGFPVLDHFSELDKDTLIVYELSCHQLSDLEFSPHVAVFLNLYEDHLDRYITMENYFNAKKNIAIHQDKDDFFFHGNDVPPVTTPAKETLINFSDAMTFNLKLKGEHNKFNATFVYKIATEIFGCDPDSVVKSIESFTGLKHRLEFLGTVNGVEYYNDSISTIPEATIRAIGSVSNTKTVLIGGMDRNINYDILIAYIREHQDLNYILSYSSGKRIYEQVKDLSCCRYVKDLKESVKLAKEITPSGSACILSPAAASYDSYKNFEHRGECFRRRVFDESELVFTGDIGFDRFMEGKWKDKDLLSSEIRNILKLSDHVITNVEGPIMECPKNEESEGAKQLLHFMDPEVADFLKNINSDIWNICNNHIMDAGPDGIKSTLKEARDRGILTIGAGADINEARKPVIIDEAGGIGMFGVGYQRACRKADVDKPGCFSWSDLDEIEKLIKDIKSRCRWCIVVAHAGEEFTPLPSPYTRERYLKYLEMGADIVVAHHPHVPMNYETVGDKAIFYSLGNFIFDTPYQRSQYNTEKGILLKLSLTPEKFTFEPYGIDIIRGEEHIAIGDLPVIFQDVPENEYKLLSPLSAKMHIAATRRQMTYLDPKRFKNATEEEWAEHFAEPMRTGRVPGETLDFHILCPLAEKEKDKEWQKSRFQDIAKYINDQMEDIK